VKRTLQVDRTIQTPSVIIQTSLIDTPEREKVSSERSGYETKEPLPASPTYRTAHTSFPPRLASSYTRGASTGRVQLLLSLCCCAICSRSSSARVRPRARWGAVSFVHSRNECNGWVFFQPQEPLEVMKIQPAIQMAMERRNMILRYRTWRVLR
jgi:hypothetical protein